MGSALIPPFLRTRAKTPMRILESEYYSDASINVYLKIAGLGMRPEGCTASVEKIAGYTGLSRATVERSLRELANPAPDGVVELAENTRRTLPGGRGTTARRRVRTPEPRERFVWIPVYASECLPPRLLRAYGLIAFAVVQKIPLTVRGLAAFLRHRTGNRAGSPISTESAAKAVKELVSRKWVALARRAGFQGRHLFQVNKYGPLSPLEHQSSEAVPSGRPDEGSGGRPDEGSLAYKEDSSTDRQEKKEPAPSAAGEVQVVGATRDAAPGDPLDSCALRADGSSQHPADPAAPASRRPTTATDGAPVDFSRKTHTVLAPVRFLLKNMTGYVLRRTAREIGHQLADGTTVERLQARLTARLAGTMVSDIRDPGRWLLGVGLPRWGCADPACESGVVWHTGQDCTACAEIRFLRSHDLLDGSPAGALPPAPPRSCCPSCDRPHRPGNEGECADCAGARTIAPPPDLPPAGPAASVAPEHRCRGRNGQCTRAASLRGLCWRCETGTPERTIPRQRHRFSAQDWLSERAGHL
ncbi:hypothetical protein [Streptomyces sp. H27-S2]|uniref:hypothetical protein n=1 Tax=Streptomyces antarcticus TaxID=2996458 RepID=UPI002271FFBE|nr:hypothetical protein [Streptomyces sp. H27-S2]MCY0953060.1 hypothetical protein [Streptomyces sp. H27-S2]